MIWFLVALVKYFHFVDCDLWGKTSEKSIISTMFAFESLDGRATGNGIESKSKIGIIWFV